ncbi:hypothetical protein [Arthrobacter polaris]|uniref:hypothetical protein n=1 Tax=Arthrobacter polaris TaxID=2813727 RepID=UPI001F3F1925|nr:hypothetical protein [Arthrobacter polaris]UIK88967.1 hypothetical protein J0916_00135 [Arthrobacter polaris]
MKRFDFFFNELSGGTPSVANIDFGLERLLATISEDAGSADFAYFPRTRGATVE